MHFNNSPVAQRLERALYKGGVVGLNPTRTTFGRVDVGAYKL